ncbi:MAG: hypothetical protein ACYS18_00465 [Planctomycetota bacterium]|jgi:hypothetical protein
MWNLFEKIINALKPPQEPEWSPEESPPVEQNTEEQQQSFEEAPQEPVAVEHDISPDF